MTSRRTFLTGAVAAGIATAAGLGACSAPATPTPSGPVELRMLTWSGNKAHQETFTKIADAYIAKNPTKVSAVKFEGITDGGYVKALTTQIAGGQAPDLAWVSEAVAKQFVASGVLLNVEATLKATEGYQFDDLLPKSVELWKKDGALHAYPFSNSPFGVYANLDLLAEAGLPKPRDLIKAGQWTWDKVAELAAAVAAKNPALGGLQTPVDPFTQWNAALGALWLSWGARPWSDDGRTCTLNAAEMVAFFEWFHRNVFQTKAIPGPGSKVDFAAGQVAFKQAQLSASAGLKDAFDWDFLPTPAGPAGTVPVVGQGAVGVVAQGRNAAIASEFLAHFTNPDSSRQLAAFFPPPRASLLTVDVLAPAATALSPEQLQGTVIDQAKQAVTKIGHAKMTELTDPMRAGLDALWQPTANVRAVLDDLTKVVQPIISG